MHGHCVRQPPPYDSHLVQVPCGKTPYIKHLLNTATSTFDFWPQRDCYRHVPLYSFVQSLIVC